LNEHRNNGHVLLQRCGNLDPNMVSRIFQATSPVRISAGRPAAPDQHEHGRASLELLVDVSDEVHAERHAVDVHEDAVATELRRKPVVQPTCRIGGVLPPVTDEKPISLGRAAAQVRLRRGNRVS
jgi:hypothetical protein